MRDSVSIQRANLCARYRQGVWQKRKANALRWAATVAIGLSLAVIGAVLVNL